MKPRITAEELQVILARMQNRITNEKFKTPILGQSFFSGLQPVSIHQKDQKNVVHSIKSNDPDHHSISVVTNDLPKKQCCVPSNANKILNEIEKAVSAASEIKNVKDVEKYFIGTLQKSVKIVISALQKQSLLRAAETSELYNNLFNYHLHINHAESINQILLSISTIKKSAALPACAKKTMTDIEKILTTDTLNTTSKLYQALMLANTVSENIDSDNTDKINLKNFCENTYNLLKFKTPATASSIIGSVLRKVSKETLTSKEAFSKLIKKINSMEQCGLIEEAGKNKSYLTDAEAKEAYKKGDKLLDAILGCAPNKENKNALINLECMLYNLSKQHPCCNHKSMRSNFGG